MDSDDEIRRRSFRVSYRTGGLTLGDVDEGGPTSCDAVVGPDSGLITKGEREQIAHALLRSDDPGVVCDALPWMAAVRRKSRGSSDELVVCCSTTVQAGVFYSTSPVPGGDVVWHFASDPRSLAELRGAELQLDYEFLRDLMYRVADKSRTPYRGVRMLGPGRSLVVDSAGQAKTVDWLVDDWPQVPDLHGHAVKEMYLETFDATIQTLVDRSGPVTFQISGGLDSTFVAASIARALVDSESALGLVASPIPGAPVSDTRPIVDDAPYAEEMGRMYANLEIERVVNHQRVTPLDVIRDQELWSYWPAWSSQNLVWASEIRDRAAKRGSRMVIIGTGGNISFSGAHPYQLGVFANRRLRDATKRIIRSRFGREGPANRYLLPIVGMSLAKPAPSYSRFRQALAGFGSGGLHPAAWPVVAVDPYRARRIVDLAARVTPQTWLMGPGSRGFARAAGKGRVPERIRRREGKGAQSPDIWAWIADARADYQRQWDRLRQTPLAEAIDWRKLDLEVGDWAWGDPGDPPPTSELRCALQLAAMGAFLDSRISAIG